MRQITYVNSHGDSLTFGRTTPFFLTDIDANSLGTSRDTQKAIGQNGQTTQGIVYNPRTIILNLAFDGILDGKYDWGELRKNWKQIVKTFLPHEKGTLYYQNAGGSYKIDCSPFDIPNFESVVATHSKFKLEMIADDPLWLAKQALVSRLGQVTGGIRFPLRYPLQYGKWITNAVIDNDTNLELPCVVELSTSASYVQVTNNTTGEFIKVDKALQNNQKLIIDTGACTVVIVTYDTLGLETAREYANYKLTSDSRYFKLVCGLNNISIDNGVASSAIPASVTYYKRFLGV